MPIKHGGQNWLPTIFNDIFGNGSFMRSSAAPAINVIETDKQYKVEIAAPGMCKEDFKVEINGYNDLTITMEKGCNSKDGECCDKEKMECKDEEKCKDGKHECNKRYLRCEFSYSKFQQTLVLPDNADRAKIEAKVKHGVLHIYIPKKSTTPDSKETRSIAIE